MRRPASVGGLRVSLQRQGAIPYGLLDEMQPLGLGEAPSYIYVVRLVLNRSRGSSQMVHKVGITTDLKRWMIEIRKALGDLVSETALVTVLLAKRQDEDAIHTYIKAKHPRGELQDLHTVFGNCATAALAQQEGGVSQEVYKLP